MNNGFLSRQGYHPRGTESSTTFCGPYTTRCWRSPDLTSTNRTGVIRGVIDDVKYYVGPGEGTLPEIGIREGGKTAGPIDRPWVALNSVDLGDTIVWIGRGDANGRFRIPQLPAGNYTITWWDEPQDYQLSTQNVTVSDGATGRGENVNLGVMALNGWWTVYDGYVFSDINRNGVKDPGEAGVPNYTLTLRKRDNSLMDRGTNLATTDQNGYYKFEAGYPTTQWLVLEAYNDSYYTTGVTYQSDNQPDPTTILDPGVDINTLPIIGLSGRVDWGVHAYDPTGATGGVDPRNGGIVGTVSYDTTAQRARPSLRGGRGLAARRVRADGGPLHPIDFPEEGTPERLLATCDADGFYQIDPATGAYKTDKLINTYVTETWENPTGCVARDVNGDPLAYGQGQAFIHQDPSGPGQQDLSARCLDTFVGGVQFGSNFGASVNGNYGFGDGCFDGTLDATDPSAPTCSADFTPLPAGDYLVKVEDPIDNAGKPLYNFTREEDINIGDGDAFVPQAALRPRVRGTSTRSTWPMTARTATPRRRCPIPRERAVRDHRPSVGPDHEPDLRRHRRVPVRRHGQADVRHEARAAEQRQVHRAHVQRVHRRQPADAPVGDRDRRRHLLDRPPRDQLRRQDRCAPSRRWVSTTSTTAWSRPSRPTSTVWRTSCCPPPTASTAPRPPACARTCIDWWRTTPGSRARSTRTTTRSSERSRPTSRPPGGQHHLRPRPTQVGVVVQLPGTQSHVSVKCPVNDPAVAQATTPELYAVTKPYTDLRTAGGAHRSRSTAQASAAATGQVLLDGTTALPTNSWSDSHIDVTVPASTGVGARQLSIVRANGVGTINGLHVPRPRRRVHAERVRSGSRTQRTEAVQRHPVRRRQPAPPDPVGRRRRPGERRQRPDRGLPPVRTRPTRGSTLAGRTTRT